MSSDSAEARRTEWEGDVLDRKAYADFLTRYILSRISGGDGTLRPFTLALDAEWGHGKTFFVEHWANDLKNGDQQCVALVFDAWKADYASDPVVSFMSDFKSCIDEHIQLGGADQALQKRATQAVQSAFMGMRRAIIPASKVVLASLRKKASGVAVDEVIEACIGEEGVVSRRSADQLGEAGAAAMNKGLDTFFEKALEEQAERRQAIGDFKASMALALKALCEVDAINPPMFVFIDELDRCRPDFAIALLEGVKHLFDIPGVCFVITTNIRQLSASVKAIYGQDFDGHGYLKRLFDVEFALPAINQRAYARLLVREYPELNNRAVLGLPPTGFSGQPKAAFDASDVLSWVAESFSLDLRSLRKVTEMTLAASSGVPQGKKVYLLWMMALVAIRHKSPAVFDALDSFNARPMPHSGFTESWVRVANMDSQREIISFDYSMNEGRRTRSHVTLGQVAHAYYEHSFTDMAEDKGDRHSYPQSVKHEIVRNEMPNTYSSSTIYPPSTAKYFELVRTAGHLISD